jgi:hypothetical protein
MVKPMTEVVSDRPVKGSNRINNASDGIVKMTPQR